MTDNLPRYISVKEVAKMFSVTERAVQRWAAENDDFPKPVKFSGRAARWSVEELVEYINKQKKDAAA